MFNIILVIIAGNNWIYTDIHTVKLSVYYNNKTYDALLRTLQYNGCIFGFSVINRLYVYLKKYTTKCTPIASFMCASRLERQLVKLYPVWVACAGGIFTVDRK